LCFPNSGPKDVKSRRFELLAAGGQPQSHEHLAFIAAPTKDAHWAEPRLVCEVEFSTWTRDGRVRHPSFQGLREDKPAKAVRQEPPKR